MVRGIASSGRITRLIVGQGLLMAHRDIVGFDDSRRTPKADITPDKARLQNDRI